MAQKKATYRNKRTGAAGSKHPDRNFDYENAEHINAEKTNGNTYGIFENGHVRQKLPAETFEQHERNFYRQRYTKGLERKNRDYKAKGHKERVRTIDQVYESEKQGPMETVLQIGSMYNTVSSEVLFACFKDFTERMQQYENFHILDFALHVDEATPHIHMRSIIDYKDKYGDYQIDQTKGLEQMGFQRPDLSKPKSQRNNSLQTWTKHVREIWYEVLKDHGLDIDTAIDPEHKVHKDTRQYKNEQILKEQEQKMQTYANKISGQEQTIQANEQAIKEQVGTKIKEAEDKIAAEQEKAFDKIKGEVKEANGYVKWKKETYLIDDEKKLARYKSDQQERVNHIKEAKQSFHERISESIGIDK